MKLVGAQVELFRNIIDSTPVEIQPDVTCLVGKNESGKTAFLHALYRLNPARPNAPLNLSQQYPAWRIKQDRVAGGSLEDVHLFFDRSSRHRKTVCSAVSCGSADTRLIRSLVSAEPELDAASSRAAG